MPTAVKILGVLWLGLVPCCAFAADTNPFLARQQAQDAARTLAVDLVTAVLDLQLRQLEENGLAELPLYRDVQTMRANVSGLVAKEMNNIVQLLAAARAAPAGQADDAWQTARQAIRDVVAQLMAERQKLHRRMNVSRLAAQAKELVARQEQASEQTRSLAALPAGERERAALNALESQTDIQSQFEQLVAGLTDVSQWGGEAAAGALDGLKIVRVYEISAQLTLAGQSLQRADTRGAQALQARALAGLAALVERLDQLQGLENTDRQAALRLVRELIARQQHLRDRCKAIDQNEQAAAPLLDVQTALHSELARLPLALARFPATVPLSEAAKAASLEAISGLFVGQSAASMDQQGHVITHLSQIVRMLEQQLEGSAAGRSADDWAAEVTRLTRLTEILAAAASNDNTTAQQSEHAQLVEQVQQLEQIQQQGPLPDIVQARINDLREQTPPGGRFPAAAVSRAAAEATMELADTRRKHKAVEVGELARAAEALERAAGAERALARLISAVEARRPLAAELHALWAAEHDNVIAIAARIAEGVQHTSPPASQQLRELGPTLGQAAQRLGQLHDGVSDLTPLQAELKESLETAARQLVAAAALIRASQGIAATQLETIAAAQLSAATSARESVGKLLESENASAAGALTHLLIAQDHLFQAQATHARAAGRPELAAALQTLHGVQALLAQQVVAESAAQELASGRASSALAAAAAQQEVAEEAKRLAVSTAGDLQTQLHAAASAAMEAGRQVLAGRLEPARQLRQSFQQTLPAALATARQQVGALQSSPAGPPDKAAQEQVAADLAAARQSALQAAAPGAEVADLLAQAREQALAAPFAPDVPGEQAQVSQSLQTCAQALERAIRSLAGQQEHNLANQAAAAGALIQAASQVDAGAAAALAQAVSAATPALPQPLDASVDHRRQERVQEKIEQATANLASREAQLKRDRDLAHLLAQFAEDQQQAREAIVDAANQLTELSPSDSTQRLMAAQALLQAQQRFVQTMTATGEGAAAVSGQEQVANQPIREGLQLAASLGNTAPQADGQQAAGAPPGGPQSDDKSPDPNRGPAAASPPNAAPPDARFVPAQPEATAQQIAGPTANAQAAQMMAQAAQGEGSPGEGSPGKGSPSEEQGKTEASQEGATASTAKKGGATKGQQTAKNESAPAGDLETAEAASADSRAQGAGEDAVPLPASGVQSEPWFARLPAELRSTIQGKARSKAPRAYEERLRRYFESVD